MDHCVYRECLFSRGQTLYTVMLCMLQDVVPSAELAAHSALVNADLYRELVSITQQMEELKIRHKLVLVLLVYLQILHCACFFVIIIIIIITDLYSAFRSEDTEALVTSTLK